VEVTLEMVKTAYEKTGLKPTRYHLICDGSACLIGALAISEGVTVSHEIYKWAWERFGISYADGLISGFDGHIFESEILPGRFLQGYLHGKEIAKAIFND